MDRKLGKLSWQILFQLEEAGEEDICGLLNEVMNLHPHYGRGDDLMEFLDEIDRLKNTGKIQLRPYDFQSDQRDSHEASLEPAASLFDKFKFGSGAQIWQWTPSTRQMVELPKH